MKYMSVWSVAPENIKATIARFGEQSEPLEGISMLGRWHVVGMGATLTLLACLSFAVQLLLGKLQAHAVSALVMVFYRSFISAIVVLIWALTTGGLNFNVGGSHWFAVALGMCLAPSAGFVLMFQFKPLMTF